MDKHWLNNCAQSHLEISTVREAHGQGLSSIWINGSPLKPPDGVIVMPENIVTVLGEGGITVDDDLHTALDQAQFNKAHIPGSVNLERRQVLEQRASIPKDKPVLIYYNTGSLSAQVGFALQVAGYENVRILQGGFADWKSKGGFDAAAKAAQAGNQAK